MIGPVFAEETTRKESQNPKKALGNSDSFSVIRAHTDRVVTPLVLEEALALGLGLE
jgi:hypothetical protein